MNEPILMDMLTDHMRYNTKRQKVLAQNVANIDTPRYEARDIKKPDFSAMADAAANRFAMRTTNGKHMTGTAAESGPLAARKDRQNFETTPMGNSVVLEEQMAKISETGAEFQVSNNLFRKFHSLYRTALGNR